MIRLITQETIGISYHAKCINLTLIKHTGILQEKCTKYTFQKYIYKLRF